jgi:alkaline phosphatase D
MKAKYDKVKSDVDYCKLIENVTVLGTWDDHDYGVNDGGRNYPMKAESQNLLLDFLDVAPDHHRRERKGVYHAVDISTPSGSVKIILLDTRYFRSDLILNPDPEKKYQPDSTGTGEFLGDAQWHWLEAELNNSKASFNLIVSSVQFIAEEHGYEGWYTMPQEQHRLEKLISTSKARNCIILSGDRHISEISEKKLDGIAYPLIDFTSSGLTHSYTAFQGEPNKYRKGAVVSDKSFGLLVLNVENTTALLKMIGENGVVQQTTLQNYP